MVFSKSRILRHNYFWHRGFFMTGIRLMSIFSWQILPCCVWRARKWPSVLWHNSFSRDKFASRLRDGKSRPPKSKYYLGPCGSRSTMNCSSCTPNNKHAKKRFSANKKFLSRYTAIRKKDDTCKLFSAWYQFLFLNKFTWQEITRYILLHCYNVDCWINFNAYIYSAVDAFHRDSVS